MLGAEGERRAANALLAAGYRIVARNARAGQGELDLVCRDGDAWVFVEVKTRRGDGYGTGLESVTPSKQERLLRAARAWMAREGIENVDWRFDVVAVTFPRVGSPEIEIVRNAFGD
jgi:putative endonuclease